MHRAMKKLRAMLAARRDQIKHREAMRLRACGEKVRYATVEAGVRARTRADEMRPVGSPALYVYPCRYCAGFHLTRTQKGSVA